MLFNFHFLEFAQFFPVTAQLSTVACSDKPVTHYLAGMIEDFEMWSFLS
jgi:hypothetical protein